MTTMEHSPWWQGGLIVGWIGTCAGWVLVTWRFLTRTYTPTREDDDEETKDRLDAPWPETARRRKSPRHITNSLGFTIQRDAVQLGAQRTASKHGIHVSTVYRILRRVYPAS